MALAVLAGCTPSGRYFIRDPSPAPLSAVVIREVALSPSPGAPAVGVWLEPGFPLPATVASWLHVHIDHPVGIDGWVPSSARGPSTAQPQAARADVRLQPTLFIYDAPTQEGVVVALCDEGMLALLGEPGTWVAVDTTLAHVRVSGWAEVPEAVLTRPGVKVFDFSGDVIEGDLVRPEGIRD